MLINLFVKLGHCMKMEGVTVTPEQLCLGMKYILLSDSDSLTPDYTLKECLKPILITSVDQENAYDKAWEKLLEMERVSDKIAMYDLIADEVKADEVKKFIEQGQHKKKSSGESEASGEDSGDSGKTLTNSENASEPRNTLSDVLQTLTFWEPWEQYNKLSQCRKSNQAHQKYKFELSVRKSILRDLKEIKDWEEAFEKALQQAFLRGEESKLLEALLEKAMNFRKDFSTIKRRWNRVMKTIEPGYSQNRQNKTGEKRSLRPEFDQGMRANIDRWGPPELFMRPMEEIRESDLLKLQGSIRLMAERFRLRLEGMRKQRSGKLDMHRTMKLSCKTYGEPVKLVKIRPKRKPAKWIVLSDVSGSVKHATRLFLSFVFELKNVMDQEIEAFAFVSKVQNITDILKEARYEDMVQRVYEKKEIDFRGYSDYGVAFEEFDRLSGHSLDRKTVLLIIGDARNNRRLDRFDLLQKWSVRAGKIIWFNPDVPEKWDEGDSVISGYAKEVHQVYDVSTPQKLVETIEKVVI